MNNKKFSLARRLRQLRNSRKLTRKEIGRETGIMHSYLDNLESGINVSPSLSVIVKLCEFYDITLAEFFTEEDKLDITVCVDVDGVILDWDGSVQKYLAEKGIEFHPEKMTSYQYHGDIGCDRKEIYKSFDDCRLYKILYDNPYPGAIDAVRGLGRHVNMQMYTGSKNHPEFRALRQIFCEELGMTGTVCPIENGKTFKAPVEGAYAVFEDCPSVIKLWIDGGYQAHIYMISHPYNQKENLEDPSILEYENLTVCRNFEEAVYFFLRDFGFTD